MFIEIAICVLLTELIVELVIKSEIFKNPVTWIRSLGSWFNTLFSCGYCFSVWVAAGVVFFTQTAYPLISNGFVNLAITALVVHRLSNYLHNFNDKWLDKYYSMSHLNTEK